MNFAHRKEPPVNARRARHHNRRASSPGVRDGGGGGGRAWRPSKRPVGGAQERKMNRRVAPVLRGVIGIGL
jgi:hypothetical protein